MTDASLTHKISPLAWLKFVSRDHPLSVESLKRILLFAALIATTGFDTISVQTLGTTRISYLLYVVLFVLLARKTTWNRKQLAFLGCFLAAALLTAFTSQFRFKSLVYWVNVVITYVGIFGIFRCLTQRYADDMVVALRWSFAAQVLLAQIPFMPHIHGTRATLFYTEASYFSFALSLYVAAVYVRIRQLGYRPTAFHTIMLVIALVSTQSETLVDAFILAFIIDSIVNGMNIRNVLRTVLLTVCALAAAYVYSLYGTDMIARTMRSFYNSSDLVMAMIGRGGARWPRAVAGFEEGFLKHPILGVGLGTYVDWSAHVDMSAYVVPWNNEGIAGFPVTNVVIELLASTGLVGTIPYFCFVYQVLKCNPRKLRADQYTYFLGALTLLAGLMIGDGGYTRPYLAMVLGMFSGSMATHKFGAGAQAPASLPEAPVRAAS